MSDHLIPLVDLRDWFAGQALPQFVVINEKVTAGREDVSYAVALRVTAQQAYALADAMMAERLKSQPTPATQYVVKPLDWAETSYGTPEVYSVAGVIRLNQAANGGWSVSIKGEVLRDSDGRTNFATLEKAKAAAQADYERRILSALVTTATEGSADA
ncbi:UNVERIFIED_ORG: hypothetical protein GGI66_003580 [Rhizobium esperanzae]